MNEATELDPIPAGLADGVIRTSELKYRRLFETAQDGILILDAETGRVNDVNPFLIKLLGLSHDEMVGKTVGELSPFRDLVANQNMLERLQKDGQVRYHDLPLETKNGRTVAVEFVSNVYSVGVETVIQCNIREITERKRAEENLRASQLMLEEIINAMPVRVFWKDKNFNYLGCNTAFAHDAGFSQPKDIIGKDDYQLKGSDRVELYRGDDRQVMESGRSKLLFEELITISDKNTPSTVLASKIPLRDAKGEIFGVLGTYMDITDRKQMQASHDRLAMVVEQAAESVVITDICGTILYANPAFERASGYTRAEALGQNPRILKSGKQNAEFYRQMWVVLLRGETWKGHLINKRKDGAIYEEEASISPVRDAANTIVNYVAVKRDVTREAQLDLQARQAQKMEAIGLLAGGVAHDFNNILAVIQMLLELLKSDALTANQSESAEGIAASVQRAAALTRQLLLFSRREVFQPRDLDLNDDIATMTKMLRRMLGETIDIRLNLAAQPLIIHADAGMMAQVLMNLCVNARDAMPNGGHLLIETAGVELDELAASQCVQARMGSFARLSVSDNGTGIPAEVLPRIFEPFFTTKPVGEGTGLGLATTFGIVQQHQGWINVYSEGGNGTTFRIYLPRIAGKVAAQSAPPPLATMRGDHETILLVEDDPALRVAVRKALAQLGYRILEAPTGVKALEVWKQNRDEISLLLTDLVMPDGMTGKDLAQRLLQEDPKLKVIYMSGYSADVLRKDSPLAEDVNFLTKPFPAQKLAKTIRDCLDGPGVSPQL